MKHSLELHGVLVVDKPAGMTSAAVVGNVRRRIGLRTAGHTGTLDPMATGVLPVCLGAATKLAQWLIADDKAYEAELQLGLETDSHDLAGAVIRRDPDAAARVDEAALRAALAGLTGEQAQVPPMYSAIKQQGVRLHELARAGVEVDRAPRPVRIDRLVLLGFAPPRARIAIACSKGTYVRSLVRDLGDRLGCGATLTHLRRTASGQFTLDGAVPLHRLDRAAAEAHIVPAARATGLASVVVAAADVALVRDGRRLDPEVFAPGIGDGRYQLVTEAGEVLAIAERAGDQISLHRVLAPIAGMPRVPRPITRP